MKTNLLKYISVAGFFLFLIACSTKKNTFLSRNSHALSSKYNILYNGGLAIDKGVTDLKGQYQDNFWEMLPIERMQISKEEALPGKDTRNPNFERAETKSAKAIQKHSMNIGGSEKNPQMDEAHLMLGKSRYYDQRFVPALEAFNYILYKYPNSDKIYEAKIWREKTNIRLDNDAIAVNNLNKLLKEIKFKDQIFADANASLAQAFLNLGQKDSAVVKMKLAKEFTEQNEEKARYDFILGQLYEDLGHKDSAYASYQSVIDMKRQAARQYVIQAHARQAAQFDYEKGDTTAFVLKYKELLKDRENRPYLDVLNHQMALFYDKNKKFEVAKKYYNASLKSKSQDQYQIASNYRNLADIYFNANKYVTAGKYYDSTLVQINPKTREYRTIKKKRENLEDVIKYEAIATRNDSIIHVFGLSETERTAYYEAYIVKLKKDEEIAKALAEKAAQNSQSVPNTDGSMPVMDDAADPAIRAKMKEIGIANKTVGDLSRKSASPPSSNPAASTGNAGGGSFYFYNPTTVAFGKNEFRKIWGDRKLKNNWRLSSDKGGANASSDEDAAVDGSDADVTSAKDQKPDERYTADFYIQQIPKTQVEIDSIAKERNFAYYQLGVIYKEKFKEYKLAVAKLEKLLDNKPEERLILPSMYNLYKLYEILDQDKAAAMKARIIKEYPESRYAQILNNPNPGDLALTDTPEAAYNKLFKLYESGDYRLVLTNLNIAIDQFTGEEMLPKFELLKANTVGKLKGLEEFKKALNYVGLTYPNSEEGRQAEFLREVEVPKMEKLNFNEVQPYSWKIVYKSPNPENKNTKNLVAKIQKFIKDRGFEKITMSNDIYTMDQDLVVIHGMKTEEYAKGIASILKEFKEYKIQDVSYIISSDNYKIIQIKKNFEDYLKVGTQPIKPATAQIPDIPVQATPQPNIKQGIGKAQPAAQETKNLNVKETDPNAGPPAAPGRANPSVPNQLPEIKPMAQPPAAPGEIKRK